MNRLLFGTSFNPWHNLAVEEILFGACQPGMALYLWQNRNTVVIGRNQNAWRECRLELLEADGGRLARRTTGGGAVYHDLGNLNFTFVTERAAYDLPRQLSVILSAARALGVPADFTGRNDLVTATGTKFSGNAFRFSREVAMHHGTILVSADLEHLAKYLAPSPAKLAAKGVASVRARVCNLSEYGAHITVDAVRAAVIAAFAREYGAYESIRETDLDAECLRKEEEKHGSWAWRVGATPAFDLTLATRFPWGGLELALSLKNGEIVGAQAWSDAMDEAFIRALPGALTGVKLAREPLAEAVRRLGGTLASDIAAWLAQAQW